MRNSLNIYILIIMMLLYVIPVDAQKYHEKPQLDKYVGTWEWKNGNNRLQIVLTKQKVYSSGDEFNESRYRDVIIGWHSYTKNGKVIESSMDKVNRKYTDWSSAFNGCSIIGSRIRNNAIFLSFYDVSLKKYGEVELKLITGEPNKLEWRLEYAFDAYVLPDGENEDYTVPKKMILKEVPIAVPWQ